MSKGKLEPRAKNGIFMGYGRGVKGFRIWSPSEGKVILSRDVTFDEKSLLHLAESEKGKKKSQEVTQQVEVEATTSKRQEQPQSNGSDGAGRYPQECIQQ